MKKCNCAFSTVAKKYSFEEFESFMESLRFQGKTYSVFNAALISIQKPGMGLILTASVWKKHGMIVKEKAVPIVILQPFGPVNFVYEQGDVISDGSEQGESFAKRIQSGFFEDNGNKRKITQQEYGSLKDFANSIGIKVEEKSDFGSNCGGMLHIEKAVYTIQYEQKTIKTPFVIYINSKHDTGTKTKSLLHELGHFLCGHKMDEVDIEDLDKKIMLVRRNDRLYKRGAEDRKCIQEYEAEVVCKIICERYNFNYLDIYLKKYENYVTEISMDHIINASDIIDREWTKIRLR